MVELVDTADLNSRENCSKKSDIDSNINYDGFVPHTVSNPLGRNARLGSNPSGATKITFN